MAGKQPGKRSFEIEIDFGTTSGTKSDKTSQKWFPLVVAVLGIASVWGSYYWWSSGEIVIREGGDDVGRGGTVAGRLGSDHALYRPLCLTWLQLGAVMLLLSGLTVLSRRELFLKLSAWSVAAFLLLAFATVLIAKNWGS